MAPGFVVHDVRVWVINLTGSVARRARMRVQLERAGVDYAFFNAVEGARGYDCFESYRSNRYLINTGRLASDGEVGCYASHIRLWKRCVALNTPVVVMEDDAELADRFPAALSAAEGLIEAYGFIRLQSDRPQNDRPSRAKRIPVATTAGFTLHYFAHYPYGTLCYAIAPRAAATFIRSSRDLVEPVDFFIRKFWVHGQPLYGLTPYTVEGGPLRFATTIRLRKRNEPTLGLRVSRASHKLLGVVQRARFNLANRSRIDTRKPLRESKLR